MADVRLELLDHWSQQRLKALGLLAEGQPLSLEPASADASFRRYFRLRAGGAGGEDARQWVVMDAPPDKEDTGPFVAIARWWHGQGIHVPAILSVDTRQGFLLMDDLGDRQYLPELDDDTADSLYGDAIQALLRIQSRCRSDDFALPAYDEALLHQEMGLFTDWLLGTHLGMVLDKDRRAMLDQAFDDLVQSALEQPRVTVHRDYHSRNLMITKGDNPGVLDFQDAVRGPLSYDLVSLLRDCYIAWPEQRVDGWAADYYQAACMSGILNADQVSLSRFIDWFDAMGIQRHLKAAGIFARLYHRDGKSGYLGDVSRTLGYVVSVSKRQPRYAALGQWIEQQVLPAFAALETPR